RAHYRRRAPPRRPSHADRVSAPEKHFRRPDRVVRAGRSRELNPRMHSMLAPEFTLRDDFPPAAYDEWRALAEADLQGASCEQKLVTHTYEGIDIQPVYTRRDRPSGD